MEIILNKDIAGLGKAGAVVKVKDGYALNYLLPKGLAMLSTAKNLKTLEAEKQKKNKHLEKIRQQAEQIKEKLAGLSITMPLLVHDDERLYAAITAQDICRVLKEEGFEIEKSFIQLEEPIRSLGIYEVAVKLHPEVSTKIKIWIVKK